MTTLTRPDGRIEHDGSARRTALRAILPVAGIALVVNLLIHTGARVLGADLVVRTPIAPTAMPIAVPQVIAMSLIPVLLAGLVALAVTRWAPRSWSILAWLGLAFGVLSMPILMEASPATKLALSLMHLSTAVLWWWRLRRAARTLGSAR